MGPPHVSQAFEIEFEKLITSLHNYKFIRQSIVYMSVPFYSKLEKTSADLVKADDFELNKKFSVRALSSSGVAVTSSVTVKGDDAGKQTVGNIKLEHKCQKTGDITGEADTGHLLSLTWKTPEVFLKGNKFEIKAKHDKSVDKKSDEQGKQSEKLVTKCSLLIEDQYTRDKLATTASLNLTNSQKENAMADAALGFSGVVGSNGWVVGGEVETNLEKVSKGNLAIGYLQKESSVVFKTSGVMQGVTASYYQAVLPKVHVATVASYSFKDGSKGVKFALSHDIDESSSVRGAVSVDSKATTVSGLYAANLNKFSRLSISSIVDVKKFAGGDHRLGVKLEIGDL